MFKYAYFFSQLFSRSLSFSVTSVVFWGGGVFHSFIVYKMVTQNVKIIQKHKLDLNTYRFGYYSLFTNSYCQIQHEAAYCISSSLPADATHFQRTILFHSSYNYSNILMYISIMYIILMVRYRILF